MAGRTADAVELGETARAGLGEALIRLGAARLAADDVDDLAELVPGVRDAAARDQRRERGGRMVARPPVRVSIEPMRLEHLPSVHAIEQASFSAPWPANAYRSELETNRLASYLVARVDDDVVGYGGMWLMVDEAHITTFAIHPAWRRQHIGERLLLEFVDVAILRRAREMTLEVRLSNLPARRLYEKFGFRPVGVRPRYYSDDHEDALIMTTLPLSDASMVERIERLRVAIEERPGTDATRRGAGVTEPLILSIESSCDETGIAVIADGRRIVSNVVASQVAMHAASGGIVPEVAARAHLRWIVPVLDEAWADAGVGWPDLSAIAVTYGPGLAGSLLVGVNFAKALAWVHDLPLIGVNHLEGHVYAAWLRRSRRRTSRAEPVFPLVALVVSGGHTFLVEMRDHLTYRLLGTTVDDAAGEAFDKVGRLLGLGYPGRTGDRAGGRGGHGSGDGLPASLAAGHVRLQLLGAQDRGPADRHRRACRRRASPLARRAAAGRRRGRALVGLPGLGDGRADDQDDPGRARGRRPVASCSAAAWPPTRPCVHGSPARRRRSASR